MTQHGWYRTQRAQPRACMAALLLALCAEAAVAHAEDDPRALVICGKCVIDADVAAEKEVRRALGELKRFQLAPPQRVDFEAVQLGLDCSEENTKCLRAAADELKVDALFVATLSQQNDSSSLRVLYFDVAHEALRSVTRSRPAAGSARKWRSELPAMLSELLAAPPKEPAAVAAMPAVSIATPNAKSAAAPAKADDAAASEPVRADSEQTDGEEAKPTTEPTTPAPAAAETNPSWFDPMPTGALLLGAGGLLAITGGLVVGAMARATESTYEGRVVDSRSQAQQAERDRARGEREALISNLLLGTGAAALVGSGVWLVVDRQGRASRTETALAPTLGPDGVGLVLAGSFEVRP